MSMRDKSEGVFPKDRAEQPPMDRWIAGKIGLPKEAPLTAEAVRAYQEEKKQEILAYVREKSPFYRKKLESAGGGWQELPFTTAEELRGEGGAMVCVPQGEISRIVTLDTSGTGGPPKRVYFTEADQELTVDFFHHGMQNLIDPSDRILILMPCRRPGSIGILLAEGIRRMGAETVPFGLLARTEDVFRAGTLLKKERITSMVGTPRQVARLAEETDPESPEARRIRTVLLSAEYVEEEAVSVISRRFGCMVFEHYGMTETGLGGAVGCRALRGYHPREADLYFEIIVPAPVPKTAVPSKRLLPLQDRFPAFHRQFHPAAALRSGETAADSRSGSAAHLCLPPPGSLF